MHRVYIAAHFSYETSCFDLLEKVTTTTAVIYWNLETDVYISVIPIRKKKTIQF